MALPAAQEESLAPSAQKSPVLGFLSEAERCTNCGKRLGWLRGLRGFGFRASGHEARCRKRTQQQQHRTVASQPAPAAPEPSPAEEHALQQAEAPQASDGAAEEHAGHQAPETAAETAAHVQGTQVPNGEEHPTAEEQPNQEKATTQAVPCEPAADAAQTSDRHRQGPTPAATEEASIGPAGNLDESFMSAPRSASDVDAQLSDIDGLRSWTVRTLAQAEVAGQLDEVLQSLRPDSPAGSPVKDKRHSVQLSDIDGLRSWTARTLAKAEVAGQLDEVLQSLRPDSPAGSPVKDKSQSVQAAS